MILSYYFANTFKLSTFYKTNIILFPLKIFKKYHYKYKFMKVSLAFLMNFKNCDYFSITTKNHFRKFYIITKRFKFEP